MRDICHMVRAKRGEEHVFVAALCVMWNYVHPSTPPKNDTQSVDLLPCRPFLLPCLVGGLLIVAAGLAAALLLKEVSKGCCMFARESIWVPESLKQRTHLRRCSSTLVKSGRYTAPPCTVV